MKKKIFLLLFLVIFSVIFFGKTAVSKTYATPTYDYRDWIPILKEKHKVNFTTPTANFEVYVNDKLVHTTSTPSAHTPTVESVFHPGFPIISATVKLGDKIRVKSISKTGSGSSIVSYDLQVYRGFKTDGSNEKMDLLNTGDYTTTADVPGLWGIFLNVSDNYRGILNFGNWSEYGNWRTTWPKPGMAKGVIIGGWYFTGIGMNVVPGCDNLEYAKANPSICCKELYEKHYLQDKTINITTYLKRGQFYCCEDLGVKIPGFKTGSLYKTYCEAPPPPPEPEKCDYKLDTQCPGNCFSQTSGYVKDIAQNNNMQEWKCIFDSRNSSLPKVRDHYQYKSVDNRYCQVYCREEIRYQFPKNGFEVEAGQHFTVGGNYGTGNWSPIRFDGYMDCRTKGNANNNVINHKQFVIDYAAADKTVVSTWDTWQTEQVRDISRNQAKKSSTKDCHYTCDYFDGGIDCCASAKWDSCYYGSKNECTGGYDDEGKCKKRENTCEGDYRCTDKRPKTPKGYYYTPSSVTRGPYTAIEQRWCSVDGPPSSKTPSAASAYSSAYNYRENLKNMIFRCNEWTRNYNEFSPVVQLDFDGGRYSINFDEKPHGTLQGSISNQRNTTTYYSGSTYSSSKSYTEKLINRADCNSTFARCVTNKQEYPDNDNKKYELYKTYTYGLNNNVYRYVTKPGGVSQHTAPAVGQYINMGYPNLPIHYAQLAGDYDISLRYQNFGNNNKFNKFIFDKVAFPYASSKYYNCSNTYRCEYEVYNDFMECDPPGSSTCTTVHKDLTVVFRPVSLTNPFPGEKAPSGGRKRGSNWSTLTDILKITKNRGLSDPERIFFDRQPMYEITLNTQSILAIRNHNRNVSGGFSDFKLTCITGQGRECKSDFIRTKFRNLFVGGRCGMSTNWDQCSQEDR